MPQSNHVRWWWLRGMYIYTIVGEGGLGTGMLVVPDLVQSTLGWPVRDPIMFGVCGSVYLAFGLLSILGLRSPLRFAPVLLLQLAYKLIWFPGVILPTLMAQTFPTYATLYVVIFASYIIGDLIAIPFPYVFGKQADRPIVVSG